MTSMQEAADMLCKPTFVIEEGDEFETDGGIDFNILKAICQATLFARDVWESVVEPGVRQGQEWFVIDGAALAEAFETIRGIRDDGRAFTVVGFECAMHFESEDGEHVTLKANLASIKVKVVPFHALVRQWVDLS